MHSSPKKLNKLLELEILELFEAHQEYIVKQAQWNEETFDQVVENQN